MSHEIRTPLNGMLGMLELLSLTPLDREQEETLKVAWDSSRSLLRIVNDILDWSKIEEGKLALAPQPTSIPQLLQDVVNTYSRVASAKTLLLGKHADARLGTAHIVDALRLSQVLNNFVSNAIKFTQHGEIELRAELLDQLDSGERIRFSVKDTGIGISKDVQEHLFQRYRQESADTARMYGGTGLGLAICRRLAELMDGIDRVGERAGSGVDLQHYADPAGFRRAGRDVAKPASRSGTEDGEPLWRSSVDAPLVLAVDDHPINRDLLARQISHSACEPKPRRMDEWRCRCGETDASRWSSPTATCRRWMVMSSPRRYARSKPRTRVPHSNHRLDGKCAGRGSRALSRRWHG